MYKSAAICEREADNDKNAAGIVAGLTQMMVTLTTPGSGSHPKNSRKKEVIVRG